MKNNYLTIIFFISFLGNEEYVARTTTLSISIFILIVVPISLILIIFVKRYFSEKADEQEKLLEQKHWQCIENMRLQQLEVFEAITPKIEENVFDEKEEVEMISVKMVPGSEVCAEEEALVFNFQQKDSMEKNEPKSPSFIETPL